MRTRSFILHHFTVKSENSFPLCILFFIMVSYNSYTSPKGYSQGSKTSPTSPTGRSPHLVPSPVIKVFLAHSKSGSLDLWALWCGSRWRSGVFFAAWKAPGWCVFFIRKSPQKNPRLIGKCGILWLESKGLFNRSVHVQISSKVDKNG